MNKIKINNFILRHEPLAKTKFNLYELYVSEKGKSKGKEVEKTIAYGITLPYALEIISTDKAINSDIKDLKAFCELQTETYQRLSEKLLELGKHLWYKFEADKPKGEISEGLKKYHNERKRPI